MIMDKKFDYVPILKNSEKYKNSVLKQLKLAGKEFGYQVFSEFSLPTNFDYSKLTGDYFLETYTQEISIPLTTNNLKKLMTLPKKAINTPFFHNKNGQRIAGQYMIGNLSGKPVLYAFSIVQDDKSPNETFNIKLDVCVNGKQWLQIARLDSVGTPHPNFYDENQFAQNESELTFVPTPHMHYAVQRSQVLNNIKFDYLPAKHVALESYRADELSTTLERGLDYFSKSTKIQDEFSYEVLTEKNYSENIFKDSADDSRFIYSHDDATKFMQTHFNLEQDLEK